MNGKKAASAILLGLVLTGCVEELAKPTTGDNITHRSAPQGSTWGEGALRQEWVGKKKTDLVKALGAPQSVIGATVQGRRPSEAYLYEPGKNAGGSCLHAFVVSMETGEILDYFCR